ncbi:class I SAM-dependent methyltransferase [Paracoccus sp. (in: a-proteobacteria)]|uniref:class I SAM-dependent methyltransferase n=1 Tax=Paracoccus sp. TaxID=267 RepID=UPI0035AFF624
MDRSMTPVKAIGEIPIDKMGLAHYFANYERYLGPLRDRALDVLELGVANGDSLKHWEEWLPRARITGLDIKPCPATFDSGRVACYVGEQQDRALLDRIAAERAPGGFDVIIDDAAHVGQLARISFWHLFEHHLKPGGYYFIEDWGTGYWPQYPDGKHFRPETAELSWHERMLDRMHGNAGVKAIYPLRKLTGWMRWNLVRRRFHGHDCGMVGFVKELVDECGAEDMTHPGLGTGTPRRSRFEWMRVSLGHVVIRKVRPAN